MAIEIGKITEQQGSSKETTKAKYRYNIYGKKLLVDYTENQILQDIALRISHGRRLVIPIGLPQSGKSMFIASLIAYAFKRTIKDDDTCNFEHVIPKEESGVQLITDALDKRKTLPSTTGGEFNFIDLNMKSRYRRKEIKITLIDFSGEDIGRLIGIDPDIENRAEKIEKILAACVAQKAIFAIITPVEIGTTLGEVSHTDKKEAEEMKSFIDKLKNGNLKLYNNTKFIFVISKWDYLPERIDSEKYLKLHRTQLHSEFVSSGKYCLIPFSVGHVVGETIIDIVLRSPKNFWYSLYRWNTGKYVLPWWKRLFS